MRKAIFLILVTIGALVARGQEKVINDPNAVSRTVGTFTEIEVSSAIDLYISQSDKEGLAVSAKDVEDRDHIRTEVSGHTLKISYDQGHKWNRGDKKLRVYIAVKTLTLIKSSGASDVYISGKLTGDLLELSMNGASDFKGEVEVKRLVVGLSGASDTNIKGSAEVLEISASGASDFKGYDLLTERCSLNASGASKIKITVNKELDAKLSGASDIYYKGTGLVKNIQSSGASSIVKKDK
ncbi:head GIN domain-containing protein [Pinibacter soli]|uniref:Head GIN domain-containing protein n=1 Tax=Pinibacter soli TaxID=3044211 RepID=A0ABT6RD29_9BACT|nr:head GIN domain-containing protein [Pinibacter soli]MDI3320482.1 head GIN domain-containing protein [Pinibacter soli]